MIDKAYLQDLLAILKVHNVKSVKMQGLELEFNVSQTGFTTFVVTDDQSTEIIAENLKQQEQSLPPDLRVENINSFESVMNWSSPDQHPDEPEMPLTGEQAL